MRSLSVARWFFCAAFLSSASSGAEEAGRRWDLELSLEKDGAVLSSPRMLVADAQPASMSMQDARGGRVYAIALVASAARGADSVCVRLSAGEGDSGRLAWQAEPANQNCMPVGAVWRWQAQDAGGAHWKLSALVRQGRDPKIH